jgi:hypothetical protein
MEDIKQLIRAICNDGGVKKAQLIVDIITDYHKNNDRLLKGDEIVTAIDELVKAEKY